MKEIYVCNSESEFIQIMDEIEDPIGVPLTLTVIDYEGSIYKKLDELNIVGRLYHISQLGVLDKCYDFCFKPSNTNRYSHSLIFATKIDHISQTHGLDRNKAVIAAMLHDVASTPKSDPVAEAMGLSDEKCFEKVIKKCPQLDDLLREYSLSKSEIIKTVKGEDESVIGQLVNSKDSIDVDRYSYTLYDGSRLGLYSGRRSNIELTDPFKTISIVDNKVVFTDKEEVKKFLGERAQMFREVYKNKDVMAKEAFLGQATRELMEKGLIDEDSIFDMVDFEFEGLVVRNCGELGKRIFSYGGFQFYGATEANEENVGRFLKERTNRPFALKNHKPVNPATGTLVMIKEEIKPFREWEPEYSEELKKTMSEWDRTNIYGYENDKELAQAVSAALKHFEHR
jgi:HD superfamily phosphohydrolase